MNARDSEAGTRRFDRLAVALIVLCSILIGIRPAEPREHERKSLEELLGGSEEEFRRTMQSIRPIVSPVQPQEGAARIVGLAVRGATFGMLGASVPPRTPVEGGVVFLGAIGTMAALVSLFFIVPKLHNGLTANPSRLRTVAIVAILCGAALLAYNILNFEPSHSSIAATGMYYPVEAKVGLAAGAVLIAGGILLYRRAGPRDDGSAVSK